MTDDEPLTEEEWIIRLEGHIRQGKPINTDEEHFPLVQKWLYRLACKFHDQGQKIYELIATNELIKLEKEFGAFK